MKYNYKGIRYMYEKDVYLTINNKLIWSTLKDRFISKYDRGYIDWKYNLSIKECSIYEYGNGIFSCHTDYICHHKNTVSTFQELISILKYYKYSTTNLENMVSFFIQGGY